MKSTFSFIFQNAKSYYGVFIKIVLCIIAVQSISLITPYATGLIIDNFFTAFDFKYVATLVVFVFILNVISRLIRIVQENLDINRFFFNFMKETHLKGIEKTLDFSVGQHTAKNSGVKDTIMNKGVNAIRMIVQLVIYDLLPLILQISIISIGLFFIDWRFGLIGLSAVLSIVGTQIILAKQYIPKFQELEKLQQNRGKGITEVLRNIFLVKNNGAEQYAYDHVEELFSLEHQPAKKYWTKFLNKLTLSGILISFFMAIMFLVGAWQIGKGELTPGMFVVISTWTGMLLTGLFSVQYIQRNISSNLPAIREYKEFLDLKPDITVPKNPLRPDRFDGKIEFKNISFKYPDEDVQDTVLRNISFTINAKETVGIVGRSGSGKSTLTKLLLRNYDAQKGKILIDGNDLKKIDPSWYLQHIGYVEQSTQLFDATIRENLAFATTESLTEEDYEKALKQAGLLDFIQKLPNGLDTKIGEQGIKLSGGQRQRLAIARALIKKPALLILDEATASLDTEKEREIQEAIDNLAKENISATKIVIAHRLSTIVNADRIFVFDEGKIVDIGTHQELLDRCSIYQNLYNLQYQNSVV